MPKISVLIPIYNVEQYLEQCLNSIKQQTLHDFEALCINDGSTDNSKSIIEKYASADNRFVLLDKENGGYGKALNFGLQRAQGDYIAIVEPDDFIHPNMFEDLYFMAHNATDCELDIVKGSYYNFYDARGGYTDSIELPGLHFDMPSSPCVFELTEHLGVFNNHPSIWTAIYKKDFLTQHEIRFIEPRGAGWADNPFLLETLLQAKQIGWIPKAYYYYRQTNPSASSFVKDFHVPFDRMRDMRGILKRLHANDEVLQAFYHRELMYIDGIVQNFSLDENPNLPVFINEVIESMSEELVYSSPYISQGELTVFRTFKNRNAQHIVDVDTKASAPEISVLIPISRHPDKLELCLDSILSQNNVDTEIVLICCNAYPGEYEFCRNASNQNSAIKLLASRKLHPYEGVNKALSNAVGKYCVILSPQTVLAQNALNDMLSIIQADDNDAVFFDREKKFDAECWEALRYSHSQNVVAKDYAYPVYSPLNVKSCDLFCLNMIRPEEYSAIYRTSFLRNNDIYLQSGENLGACTLNTNIIMHSDKWAYVPFDLIRPVIWESADIVNEQSIVTEMNEPEATHLCSILPHIWDIIKDQILEAPGLKNSFGNLALSIFSQDIDGIHSGAALKAYLDTWNKEYDDYLTANLDILQCWNPTMYSDYQVFKVHGSTGLAARLNDRKRLESIFLRDLLEKAQEHVDDVPHFSRRTQLSKLIKRMLRF